MHPMGKRTIPEVATRTKPSCWDESSSLQTTVRGNGIDFDILGKRSIEIHHESCKKSGIFVLHETLLKQYLFCCCLGFDAALLQQSISPPKDRALANLTWERWEIRGDISPLSPSCCLISARMTY